MSSCEKPLPRYDTLSYQLAVGDILRRVIHSAKLMSINSLYNELLDVDNSGPSVRLLY